MRTGLALTLILLIAISCDKKLPEEEQQKLQKEANERKIQRITNQEIIDIVQSKGRELESIVAKNSLDEEANIALKKYLGAEHQVQYAGSTEIKTGMLREIMEAYLFSIAEGNPVGTNLQELEDGNFLYSIPNVSDSAGITILNGVWQIELSKKHLIQEISVGRED